MADNLLNTSISAVTTEIINSISSASVDELLDLARSAAALGQSENTSIESAINTRVNQLITTATPDEIKKLSDAIKKVRNETQVESQIGNTDNLSEGLTNLYYKDLRVETYLDSGLSTPSFATASIANIAYPTTDGTNRQVMMTDGSGNLSFENLDTIHTEVTNDTGSTILKGTPVYQTGTSGNAMTIAPADASDSAKMPAVGVLEQDLVDGASGFVIHLGQITGVDTSAFSEGDIIYVAVGGGYTNTAPTGENNLLQNLGRVTKVHATNGGGVIMGAGRTNAVPNLNDGNIFIGDATNRATTASLNTSIQNYLSNVSGDIVPDTDITYDLGSTTNRFRDLYLSGNTINLGDATISADADGNIELDNNIVIDGQQLSLIRPPEQLTLNVHAPDSGQNADWRWTWESSVLYSRSSLTDSVEVEIPIYRQGTYEFVNFAYTLQGNMTQTHTGVLKTLEGAGAENLVPNVVTTIEQRLSPFTGQTVDAQVSTWTIPADFSASDIVLVQPTGHTYYVSNNGTGAYTYSASGGQVHGVAEGDNVPIGPLYRGTTYTFEITATGHPFYFTTDDGTNYVSGNYVGEYTDGVTNSRTDNGTITFTVPSDAPDTLYYQCGVHGGMQGEITIKDVAVESTTIDGDEQITLYFQHSQEQHVVPVIVKNPVPIPDTACIMFDGTKFVIDDMVSYYNRVEELKTAILSDVADVGYLQSLTSVSSHILPDTNETYDLGSPTNRFRDLYLSGNTIDLGGTTITSDGSGGLVLEKLQIGTGDQIVTLTVDSATGELQQTSTDTSGDETVTETVQDEYRTTLYQPGELRVIDGTERWYANKSITITGITARLATAADAVVGVTLKVNRSSTVDTVDLSIGANVTKREITDAEIQMTEDEYLTVDVTSIGSTDKGEDLNIVFTYTED